jgi:hypothetical protein
MMDFSWLRDHSNAWWMTSVGTMPVSASKRSEMRPDATNISYDGADLVFGPHCAHQDALSSRSARNERELFGSWGRKSDDDEETKSDGAEETKDGDGCDCDDNTQSIWYTLPSLIDRLRMNTAMHNDVDVAAHGELKAKLSVKRARSELWPTRARSADFILCRGDGCVSLPLRHAPRLLPGFVILASDKDAYLGTAALVGDATVSSVTVWVGTAPRRRDFGATQDAAHQRALRAAKRRKASRRRAIDDARVAKEAIAKKIAEADARAAASADADARIVVACVVVAFAAVACIVVACAVEKIITEADACAAATRAAIIARTQYVEHERVLHTEADAIENIITEADARAAASADADARAAAAVRGLKACVAIAIVGIIGFALAGVSFLGASRALSALARLAAGPAARDVVACAVAALVAIRARTPPHARVLVLVLFLASYRAARAMIDGDEGGDADSSAPLNVALLAAVTVAAGARVGRLRVTGSERRAQLSESECVVCPKELGDSSESRIAIPPGMAISGLPPMHCCSPSCYRSIDFADLYAVVGKGGAWLNGI